ncbi:MAG: PKD domain-containing protein [Bacteroidota bacterium]
MKRPFFSFLCKFFLWMGFGFLLPGSLQAQVTPPTVQSCGPQEFCLDNNVFDLCVELTVTTGLPAPIDYFEIDWGDNTAITTVPGSNNPADQNHIYDLTNFYLTCSYDISFFVVMETFLTNGEVLNSSFRVTFLNPPIASFTINPSVICVGEEACFRDNSCPTENLSLVSWDYGDGSPAGTDRCHVYNQVGTYTVTLTVENPCGMATATQQLQVIEPPEAVATITSNNVDVSVDPHIHCLGSGLVDVNGDSLSINENFYEWGSLNGVSGASWVLPPNTPNDATPNIPSLSISFTDTGFYEIILLVNNDCDQPDYDTLFIRVLSGESLSLPSQPDACLTLDYTPGDFNPNATYTINGNVVNTFPTPLGVGTYEVIASIQNECGSQMLPDQFEVFGQEAVTLAPIDPDTICVDSDSILLLQTPTGGIWTGDNLAIYGDSAYFIPDQTGTFIISYEKGIGACRDEESIQVTVEDSGINTIDYNVCSTSPPFPMGATPLGGTYTSTDCPLCIQNDTFLIDQMVALGLTSVEVNYNTFSASGCEGANTFTVQIEDPVAAFTVDSIFCEDDPILVDFSTAAGSLTWEVDGQNAGSPPFSNLSTGDHLIVLIAEAGDCERRDSQNIYIATSPSNVSFEVQPLSGCADLEITLNNTTASFDDEAYEWYLGDSLFSTAIQPGTITLPSGLNDTTYVIRLLAANSCRGEEAIEEVIVFPQPRARFGPMQDDYCSGEVVEFANVSTGGPMNSWLWDYGNGMTSTDSIPLEITYFADSIPRDYIITLTASNDCGTQTFDYTLTVNPTDVRAFFNISAEPICVGEDICLTNLSTPGAGFLWNLGDGNTNTASTFCHSYSAPGTYTISLRAFGCGFDSTFATVIVDPLPSITIGNLNIECPGDSMLFFLEEAINVDGYQWRFGDGDSSSLVSPLHLYTQSGPYRVRFTGTSVEGCVQQDSVDITVPEGPEASFTISTDSICVGEVVDFSNTSTGSIISCLWAFGDGNTSNLCDPSIDFDEADTYTIRLIVTNTNGCRDTAERIVVVSDNPAPGFDFVINRQCTPAEISVVNTSQNANSYVWDFGNGETSTEAEPVVIYPQAGTYQVQLRAINAVCSQSISKAITIYQTPEPLLALSANEGCAPFEISLGVAINQPGLDYEWSISDGISDEVTLFDSLSTYRFEEPGRYGVRLLIASEFCQDSIVDSVEIFEPVLIASTVTDNLCFGDANGQVQIDLESGTGAFQYEWSNGAATEDLEDLENGNYGLSITDSNGCELIDSFVISSPLPVQVMVSDSAIASCAGDSDAFICLSVEGGIAPYTIDWANGQSGDCLENIPAGNYGVQILDANGCRVDLGLQAYENSPIEIVETVEPVSCFGFGDGRIQIDSISGGVSDFYNTTLLGVDTLENGRNFSNLQPGTYTLVVQDLEGCTLQKDYMIGEPDSLWAAIREDTIRLPLGESVFIDMSHNAANPLFVWLPDDSLSCADCESPLASPINTTWYSLLLEDAGCFARDSVLILVDKNRQFYVPNIFTPNEDGRNDRFRIRSRVQSIRQIITFQIFDRWGEKIFQADNFRPQDENPDHAWNGTFRGKRLAPDTFTYWFIVEYEDDLQEKVSGTITLMR